MATFNCRVLSREKPLFVGEVKSVVAPAQLGDIGILPGHIPLLTLLKNGVVEVVKADGSSEQFFVRGGILEVQPNLVTVLSDRGGELLSELDEVNLEEKLKISRAELDKLDQSKDLDVSGALRALYTEEVAIADAQSSILRKVRQNGFQKKQ